MHERIQNILDDIEKSGEKVRNINVFLNDPGTTVVINYSKGEGRRTEPIDLVRRDQLDQTLNTLAARDRVEGSRVLSSDVPQQDRNDEPTDSGHVSPHLQNPCPLQSTDENHRNDEEDCDCDDDDDNEDNEGGGEEEKEEECDSAAAASDDDNDNGDDDDDNGGDGDDALPQGFENAKNNYAVPPQKPLHTADDDDNGDDVDIEFDDDDPCHQDDDDDVEEEEDASRQRTIAAAHNSDVSGLRDDDNWRTMG